MEKLKELRKKNKLTQQQLAQFLGITVSAYGNYELGQREPPIEYLCKLADYFGVSVDYILDRESPTNEKSQPAERPQADISENFIKEFGDLFSDETFIQYARLYKLMNTTQRLMILGVIIGHMEKAGIALPPML